ncbi:BTAD domain-containing putative transcriptional regulator [Glycomyces endophyticus]|uniref:BTAD domain-containing putative transcriptional regulator n=1 Tax=Glycomyces endophyticus TaxID=480996 RepID=A0ABN2HVH9_9ACTN
MPTLDVRLLGPLEVRVDGAPAAVPRGKTATILAILLDDANSVVPLDSLIRAVYGIDLPRDPETQIQNAVGVLRRQLGAARDRVETVGRAYRLRVAPDEVDLLRCKANEDRARALRLEGRTEEAAAALRAALAEWRGPALADQSGAAVEAIRRRHDEHRLALLERRLDLDLDLGRHADVVEELRQVVATHGLRQRLTGLLMRALHASGRTAEALEAYAALKHRLADALGADPDRELTALHTAILRDEPPAPAGPAPTAAPRLVPATLPRAITRFTGRDEEIRLLDDVLDAAEDEAGIAVVTGMGGVGKTALAVRWAHRVAHRFPDGQLYFNLRGFDPLSEGADPAAVLGEALSALGVPAPQHPAGLDERIGLYRTVLARRRVLVVLDNARDAAQARPLLPVAPGSFTLVTSRDRLAALVAGEGADTVPLGLMSETDAWSLLVRRIGLTRAMEEEQPVRRIVAGCGRLPLALTLIGAWAAQHPTFSIAALADRLDQTTNVFKVLAATDLGSDPRSVFACSYQVLGSSAAQAFRLFGLHPGGEVTTAGMASLMGRPAADAETALGELAGVHLIEQPCEGRYTMHDLLRAYASERLADEVAPERRRAAEERLFDYFARSTAAADELRNLHGGVVAPAPPVPDVTPEPIRTVRDATDWFEREHDVLAGLALRGAGGDQGTWRLAWHLAEYAMATGLVDDLEAVQAAALAAAVRRGDTFGQVVAHGYLSAASMLRGDRAGADRRLARAAAVADASGQPWAKGFARYGLAVQAGRDGRDAEAVDYGRGALADFQRSGDRFWEFRAVALIGWHCAVLGRFAEARDAFDRLRTAAAEAGSRYASAYAELGYGLIAFHEHRYDDALRRFATAETGFAELDMAGSAAWAGEHIGDVLAATGRADAARERWRAAEQVYLDSGTPHDLDRVRTLLQDRETAPTAVEGRPTLRPSGGREHRRT